MSRLLLVDDEPNVIHALMRVTRMRLPRTVKIEGFDNPELALLRAREISFDLVVSDFRMPQMDGLTFLGKIRDMQPHTVRMVLSASTEVETVMRAVNDVEVFRYLTKPWVEDELVNNLLLALARSESTRQERRLADEARIGHGALTAQLAEINRLEEQEPGITHVEWGPNGEVLMPDLNDPFLGQSTN